ncbi:unnamed protein product, partial [Rotaria magnacalcarata]
MLGTNSGTTISGKISICTGGSTILFSNVKLRPLGLSSNASMRDIVRSSDESKLGKPLKGSRLSPDSSKH